MSEHVMFRTHHKCGEESTQKNGVVDVYCTPFEFIQKMQTFDVSNAPFFVQDRVSAIVNDIEKAKLVIRCAEKAK